jgi:hypothetical protein
MSGIGHLFAGSSGVFHGGYRGNNGRQKSTCSLPILTRSRRLGRSPATEVRASKQRQATSGDLIAYLREISENPPPLSE